MQYEFRVSTDKIEDLAKTLKTDKEKNLIDRWNYFLTLDEETLLGRMGFVPQILRNYWVVVPIEGEDFAYSIGLTYEYDHPEIMVVGAGLTDVEYSPLLNEICCHARDSGPLRFDKEYTFETYGNKWTLRFTPYDAEAAEKYPNGFMHSFYRNFADVEDFSHVIVGSLIERQQVEPIEAKDLGLE